MKPTSVSSAALYLNPAGEGGSKTVITPETEKILFGQRKNPTKNELIGGHSPDINNSNPRASKNPDVMKAMLCNRC